MWTFNRRQLPSLGVRGTRGPPCTLQMQRFTLYHTFFGVLTSRHLLLPPIFWAFCPRLCRFVAAFFRPAPTAAFKVSITTGAAGGRTGVCDISALIPDRRDKSDCTRKEAWKCILTSSFEIKNISSSRLTCGRLTVCFSTQRNWHCSPNIQTGPSRREFRITLSNILNILISMLPYWRPISSFLDI